MGYTEEVGEYGLGADVDIILITVRSLIRLNEELHNIFTNFVICDYKLLTVKTNGEI
ncbi:hypothetical protein CAEBREN_05475 [Caenorhabditis brenneri]|uniref:Uncharacterized protein n=1 Tax=Caenorhabditis brenneri TaxID=135651 RepID=G0MRZ4_CAEBE|nr:hypothetical protein CAEBREN_05475 [Caenorhabditis brenneri]